MDEVIWVEVLSRHREVAARHRCAGPAVRIGRSYANDIVLDDPAVAPEHLLIWREADGTLVAEHLGSAGGLYLDRDRRRLERIALDGDRAIRIGHTLLRVRDRRHAVAPERVAAPRRPLWPAVIALAAAILGIEALSVWRHEIAEPKLSRYVMPMLSVGLFALGWIGCWAALTRLVSGAVRLERIAVIALGGLLAFSLYNELAGFVAFSVALRALSTYQYVVMWAILATVVFWHLRDIGRSWLPLKAATLAALFAGIVAVQTVTQSERRLGGDASGMAGELLPPSLRLRPLQPEDRFFAAVGEMKAKLDSARTEDSE